MTIILNKCPKATHDAALEMEGEDTRRPGDVEGFAGARLGLALGAAVAMESLNLTVGTQALADGAGCEI